MHLPDRNGNMNVFVLCTGRCGSMTFARACGHIRNFSVAHESRTGLLGAERMAYPNHHIEVDNRLSWLLGRLDRVFGDRATYVHLLRDPAEVAASFVKRIDRGIMKAYQGDGVLMGLPAAADPMAVALDYCDTVTANIERFIANKPAQLTIRLDEAAEMLPRFWELIGAEGDLELARQTFETRHNASATATQARSAE